MTTDWRLPPHQHPVHARSAIANQRHAASHQSGLSSNFSTGKKTAERAFLATSAGTENGDLPCRHSEAKLYEHTVAIRFRKDDITYHKTVVDGQSTSPTHLSHIYALLQALHIIYGSLAPVYHPCITSPNIWKLSSLTFMSPFNNFPRSAHLDGCHGVVFLGR
jgi:hypothetical protein